MWGAEASPRAENRFHTQAALVLRPAALLRGRSSHCRWPQAPVGLDDGVGLEDIAVGLSYYRPEAGA